MSISIKDVFTWRVTHHDGTHTPEFDSTRPDGRGFAEVASSQVKTVELLATYGPEMPLHCVVIPDGAKPIFFRRRPQIAFRGTDEPKIQTVHCIGWKLGESACYLFVMENGTTLLSDDLQAVSTKIED